MIQRRLVIHGHVQGVGYRYAMIKMAERVGVLGWVRNRSNGTVEAVIQGLPSAVEQITDWAQRGPEQASVNRVEIFDDAITEQHTSFAQWPTL